MEGYILHTDNDSMGNNRAVGVYGKDLIESDMYWELIQIKEDMADQWSEILDYNPDGEFMTVNIEESMSGSVSVTISDGSVDRTARYYNNAKVPGSDDTELFEEYVEDVLEEEDLNRLRETNVIGFKGDVNDLYFDRAEELNPEEGFI